MRQNHIVQTGRPDEHTDHQAPVAAPALPCGASTGHIKNLAGGKATGGRCNEGRHIGNFLRGAEPPHRDAAFLVCNIFLGHAVEQVGNRNRRRNAIHRDIGWQYLPRQPLGKANHACLCRTIGHGARIALLAGDRGNDDDASPLARTQVISDACTDRKTPVRSTDITDCHSSRE